MLKTWLGSRKGKVLIVAHVGDIDACASFVALKELIAELNSKLKVKFVVSGSLNKQGRRVLDLFEMNAKLLSETQVRGFGSMILVDTQLNILPEAEWPADIYVIDHHTPDEQTGKLADSDIEPAAVSTTQIIYSLFKQCKLEPSKKAARAIVYGILSDTAHFRFAKAETFKLVYDLLSSEGIDYASLLDDLYEELDEQERLAWIKSAQRVKLRKIKDKLILISYVGAYESSAASKLLGLGADMVLVISRKAKGVRIVGRSKRAINLAEIFIKASGVLNCVGGGHPNAVVLNLEAEQESAAISFILKELRDVLEKDG